MNSRGVFAELGNVLTRVMLVESSDTGIEQPLRGISVQEHTTPTSLYPPQSDAAKGANAVLEAASIERDSQDSGEQRLALVHLHGLPRAAVVGLAGLPTTELTTQGALRRAGSSVVQIKSTDAASLEAQLIDVRAVPLDLLLFTGPARQTAERLMAGGGPRARTSLGLQAIYNGPEGDHDAIETALGSAIPLRVLPPVRRDGQSVDPIPTELLLSAITDQLLAADPMSAVWRQQGFAVDTFARAFTQSSEHTAAWWRHVRESSAVSAPTGLVALDLGGRYCEMAVVGTGSASRTVSDLGQFQLMVDEPRGTPRRGLRSTGTSSEAPGEAPVEANQSLPVSNIGRWLPFDWTPTGLGDTLANYLRRPFIFPTSWSQLLLLMALGRERLLQTRSGFRASPGDVSLTGGWRSNIGMYVVSGGYLRYLPGPAMALSLALDGLEPVGVSEIWCDRWGLGPYIARHKEVAASHLTRLATVVAPQALQLDWRRPHDDDILALVTVEREGYPATNFRVVPGSLARFPLRPGERASLTVHPLREHDFGAGPGKPWRGVVIGGRLGLVFDSRGRPVALPPDGQIRQAKLREWLNTLGAGLSWEGE